MEKITWRKYAESAEADAVRSELVKHGIISEQVQLKESMDFMYGSNRFETWTLVKILPSDFAKADDLMLSLSSTELDQVAKDHYLFAFSDAELVDVVSKRDEWNELDYLLAQRILKDRGKEINPNELSNLNSARIESLRKPDADVPGWVYAGYPACLLAGFLGALMGYFVFSYKKTLPNGEVIFGYSESVRRAARIYCYLGIIGGITETAYFVYDIVQAN